MLTRSLTLFLISFIVAQNCNSEQLAASVPQTLQEAKAAISEVMAARNLQADIQLKGYLTLKYRTATFMVKQQFKVKVDPPRMHQEEGPQPDGIMMTIAIVQPDPAWPSEETTAQADKPISQQIRVSGQAVPLVPSYLLGGLPRNPASGGAGELPWEGKTFNVKLNDGQHVLSVQLVYGTKSDRELIKALLASLGVQLPKLMSSTPSPETYESWGSQKDYFLQGGFRIVTWEEAKSILAQNNYTDGKQYHTQWLAFFTKDGQKYITLQPAMDSVLAFLKESNLSTDGFATE